MSFPSINEARKLTVGVFTVYVIPMGPPANFGPEAHVPIRWVGFDTLWHCGWLPKNVFDLLAIVRPNEAPRDLVPQCNE